MSGGVPTLRAALAQARRLGLEVRPVKRTGEVRVECPAGRVNVNARRKDATPELLRLLRDAGAGR